MSRADPPGHPDAGGLGGPDVLVGGGGPVGLVAAIEARLAGLSVVVAEPRETPIDKACGEGLMPGAVPLLERLGVRPRGAPLEGVRYLDARRRVEHAFRDGHGLGVRRTTLHAALADRARELGVRVVPTRIDGIAQDAGGVAARGIGPGGDREELRAAWLLGCDGLHSTIARLAGLALPAPRARRRHGLRRHYRVEPWTAFIEVHWNPLGEIYVTPTADGVVGLAALVGHGIGYEEALAASPALAARVSGAEPDGPVRGAGPFGTATRARTAGRVLLVGDASGYADAITGEGLRLGFDQARAAIAAVRAGRPESYERDWRRVTRGFRLGTSALARAASTPARGGIVPVAAAAPWLFGAAVDRLAL